MTKNKNNYKDSGVNISEGQEFVKDIKDITDKLSPSFSLGTIGSFSGYVEIPSNYENPVFALACDGVGTKMRIALRKQSLSTIGIDLVAMCVNDLIVSGAKPIAFLDYYGCSQLNRNQAKEVIEGIVEGCKISGCDLVGGETAEMPNHYKDNNFDLVGFSMGVNEKTKIIDGSSIKDGDIILGLPSSGFHSNGYSLINNVIGDQPDDKLLSELLTPTRIYVEEILSLNEKLDIKGMAHITGGGFEENLSRINENFTINIDKSAWQLPDIFLIIQELGGISNDEMFNVFNCGIGFCIIIDKSQLASALELNKELIEIGFISSRENLPFKFL